MESKNTKQLKEAFDNWRVFTSLNEQERGVEPQTPGQAAYLSKHGKESAEKTQVSQLSKEEKEILGFFKLVSASRLELLYVVNLDDIFSGLDENKEILKTNVTLINTDNGLYQVTNDSKNFKVSLYQGEISENTAILSSEQYKQSVEDSSIEEEIKNDLLSNINQIAEKENEYISALKDASSYISENFLKPAAESITWENALETAIGIVITGAVGYGTYQLAKIFKNFFSAPRVQNRIAKGIARRTGIRKVTTKLGLLPGSGLGDPLSKNVGLQDFKERMLEKTFRERHRYSIGREKIPLDALSRMDDIELQTQRTGHKEPFEIVKDKNDRKTKKLKKPKRGHPGIDPTSKGEGKTTALANKEFRRSDIKKTKSNISNAIINLNTDINNVDQRSRKYAASAGTRAANMAPNIMDLDLGLTRGEIDTNSERNIKLLKDKQDFLKKLLKDIKQLESTAPGRNLIDFRNLSDTFGNAIEWATKKPGQALKFTGKKLAKLFGNFGLIGKLGMGAVTFVGILAAKDLLDGFFGYLGEGIVGVIGAALSEVPIPGFEEWYINDLEQKSLEAQRKLIAVRGDISKANLNTMEYVLIKSMEKKISADTDLQDALLARAKRIQNPEERSGGFGAENFPDKTPPGYEKIMDPTGKVSYKKKEKLEENKSRLKITLGILKESKQNNKKLKITLG